MHVIGIPENFRNTAEKPFDPVDMRRLFDLGYRLATSDEPWKTAPPGWDRPRDEVRP